jgi:predicted subunit of tRNA(5-methylaminomethyl-2-thiouridylate) methyltransferase
VDLAYILRRYGLEVELTTITIGANPEYAKESFYKEHMEEDGSRVERLFQVLPILDDEFPINTCAKLSDLVTGQICAASCACMPCREPPRLE